MFGKKLTPKIKETISDPEWVWVTDYYDYPLAGLCTYDDQLCYAKLISEWRDEPDIYKITRLSSVEKVKWLMKKWTFELLVGHHWTYKNGKRDNYAGSGRNRLFHKMYYKISGWFKK